MTASTRKKNNHTDTPAQDNIAKGRRKYSGNDVLRIIRALNDAKRDMDRKSLSMNEIVHILQENIEEMLKNRSFSYAELASVITLSGCPVTARTLKDYLARARKEAKEGRPNDSELKQLILAAAKKQENQEDADAAEDFTSAIDDRSNEESAGNDDVDGPGNDKQTSAACSMDDIETAEKKRQHIQDFYAARKRRKKARKNK